MSGIQKDLESRVERQETQETQEATELKMASGRILRGFGEFGAVEVDPSVEERARGAKKL